MIREHYFTLAVVSSSADYMLDLVLAIPTANNLYSVEPLAGNKRWENLSY